MFSLAMTIVVTSAVTFIVTFVMTLAFAFMLVLMPIFATTPLILIVTLDSDKVNRLTARVVFGAMLGPFFSMPRWHVQIQGLLLYYYR